MVTDYSYDCPLTSALTCTLCSGSLTVWCLQLQGSQLGADYSRPGAEPTTFGTASDWHRPSDPNSNDRVDKLSNQAGVANTRSSETSSNPDFLSSNNRPAGMTQHDSGYGSGSDTAASHSSKFGGNSSDYGAHHGHQGLSSMAPRAEDYQGQSGGSTQGYGQQGQAESMAGYAEYEPVTRLPSAGIPPVFHPPSYHTSDVPSYAATGGNVSYSSDSQGVNAKQALEPLTNLQAGGVDRETSGVNAKQALDPLTHIAAQDSQEDAAGIPIKNALQPLTEVPAQENNKGFVDSMREYLPGQQQTGTVQVSIDPLIFTLSGHPSPPCCKSEHFVLVGCVALCHAVQVHTSCLCVDMHSPFALEFS